MAFITALIVVTSVWAKGVCPDSTARELSRIELANSTSLVACGSRLGMVRDLNIYRQKGDQMDRLLDGDASVKAYRFRRAAAGFDVEEAVGTGTFRPFILVHVGCTGETCAASDIKCLWRPHAGARRQSLPAGKPENLSEQQWTRVFYAALDGDRTARELFKGASEHSERFATFKADLARLEQLGCLK